MSIREDDPVLAMADVATKQFDLGMSAERQRIYRDVVGPLVRALEVSSHHRCPDGRFCWCEDHRRKEHASHWQFCAKAGTALASAKAEMEREK